MKKLAIILIWTCLSTGIQAQNIIGAWEAYSTSEDGDSLRNVLIFSEGYQVFTTYHAITGAFVSTNGGSWKLEGDMMTEKVEFDTDNPERVGSEVSFRVIISDETIEAAGSGMKLHRVDKGVPGKLQGAWLMSGRIREGVTQTRDTNRPRKTMKMLSGTRFQWIAYNTETKQFMGTGGGTYTTIDGKYTEHIEFFSRDDSRTGMSLEFNYELIDGNWHHSGLSTKGNPINEIWSVRN